MINDKDAMAVSYEKCLTGITDAPDMILEQFSMTTWQLYNGGVYYTVRCWDYTDPLNPIPVDLPWKCRDAKVFVKTKPLSSCQWVPNPAFAAEAIYPCPDPENRRKYTCKCRDVNINYPYAQCTQHWSTLHPEWCQQ